VKLPFSDSLNGVKLILSSVKRKASSAKASFVALETEIDRLDIKFDQLCNEFEEHKHKLSAEAEKANEGIRKENEQLRRKLEAIESEREDEYWDEQSEEYQEFLKRKKIATTVCVLESILSLIATIKDEDFKLMSYSFLYPAVYSKLLDESNSHLILEEAPDSTEVVVTRGREFLEALRGASQVDLTVGEVWDAMVGEVSHWWSGTALPLLYKDKNPDWLRQEVVCESKEKISRASIDPFFKLTQFPEVVDALTIYYENEDKSEIRRSSGVLDLEAKLHRFF
jgi:hypothetical protein